MEIISKLNKLLILILVFDNLNIWCKSQVIVTPEHLNKENKTRDEDGDFGKVEVTNDKLKEIQAFRDEINAAVQQNTFKVSFDNGTSFGFSTLPEEKHVSSEPQIPRIPKPSSNETNIYNDHNQNTTEATTPTDNTTDAEIKEYIVEIKNKTKPQPTETGIIPNIVDIHKTPNDNDDKRAKKKFLIEDFLPKQYAEREVLRITSIDEDPFLLGDGVNEWRILTTESENFWIGLRNSDILIIPDKHFENSTKINFGRNIHSIETFSFWSPSTDKSIGIILLGIDKFILWMESINLEAIWNWNIGKKAITMKYYQIDGRKFLAVLSVSKVTEVYYILIYEFKEETGEFWVVQTIPLKKPTKEMIFLDTGREAILAVTQGDDVLVYDYNPDSEYKYELAEVFTSKDLESISAFKMGGYSYLAISGREPKIFRYYRGDFVPQTLFGEYFKFVQRYFPIPARTYRDDLILLVQHSLELETHNIMILEALIWNGQSFEATIDIPCNIGNETYGYGIRCMIDPERESGIAGAAIISSGRNISLIVPREEAPSGLFHIRTLLEERKTELQELEDIFDFLNKTVEEQEKVIDEAEKVMKELKKVNITELNQDSINIEELVFNGENDEVYVNNIKWIEDEENLDTESLFKELKVLDDLVVIFETEFEEIENPGDCSLTRSKRSSDHIELEVDDINIENLIVDMINNKTLEKVDQTGQLSFNGTIEFGETLDVKDDMLVIDCNKESSKYRADEEIPDTLEVDELTIDGDINFDNINGVAWSEFLSQVSLLHFPVELDTLIVNGNVTINEGLQIQTLNKISFPDGFLWSSESPNNIVTAKKNFTGLLETDVMDTGGNINGINPFSLITLSDDQVIPGKTSFRQLEVTEILELNGTVSGHGLQDFLPNPTLLEQKEINSACQFSKLKVNGNIKILENYENQNLENFLQNVVYNDEPEINLESRKHFLNTVECEDEIELTSINNISMTDFLTTETDQDLEITDLAGDVYIENLILSGTLNGYNLEDIFENNILTNTNSFMNVTLEFDSEDLINVEKLTVIKSLNDEPCDSFVSLEEDLNLEELTLENVVVDLIESETDIEGLKGVINGINLKEINTPIENSRNNDSILIDELIIEKEATFEYLNGLEINEFIKYLQKIHDIQFMVKEGLVTLSELEVKGDIDTTFINSLNLEKDLFPRVIWLDRENYITDSIHRFSYISQ